MIILSFEGSSDIFGRYAIGQDVMYSLYIERLFDLGVWREAKMETDQDWKDGQRQHPSPHLVSLHKYLEDLLNRFIDGRAGR